MQGHINQLDGLRAIAILAVIFLHTGAYFLINGPSPPIFLLNCLASAGRGVDLFFVLSGFLITGILLDTRDRPDYFRRFYWRRALRIWPLYYAFLICAFCIHPRPFSMIGIAPFALYYRNFLGPDAASDVYFGQFWSLCVEEQFYLLWPLVIYFCPKRMRLPVIATLTVAALCIRAYLYRIGFSEYMISRLTYCRMDDLLVGAAAAVLIRNYIREKRFLQLCVTAIVAGVFGICYTGSVGTSSYAFRAVTVGLSSYAVLFGGFVGLCSRNASRLASIALGNRVLRAIATRSYAMYMFHLVPLYLTAVWFRHIGRWPHRKMSEIAVIVAIAAVTYGMAWLSWRFFEYPILRLKDRFLR